MPRRVLHVSQPTTEGVARCVVDLVRDQVARGAAVVVACPNGGDLAVAAEAAGAEVVQWAATRDPGPGVLAEVGHLGRLVRRIAPDVVHLHSAKAGLAGRLALRGRTATVYQPHAWSFLAVEGWLRPASVWWECWALRWAERVVCVSEAERDAGMQFGLRLGTKAVVVPNGIDIERFTPGDRAAARAQLGWGEDPLAVCVGRLSRQKGQDVLVAAWPAVRRTVPAAQLVLVGDGPNREWLAAMAPSSTHLVGRGDPLAWYVAADVVVLPSRWEGMALVPLEAAACGRSVVVTDVAGARESMPESAHSAVVASDDCAGLAAALIPRLADRPSADLEGEQVRRHVVEHYDVRRTTARMINVYRQALREHAGKDRHEGWVP